jgi:hypothetical protein
MIFFIRPADLIGLKLLFFSCDMMDLLQGQALPGPFPRRAMERKRLSAGTGPRRDLNEHSILENSRTMSSVMREPKHGPPSEPETRKYGLPDPTACPAAGVFSWVKDQISDINGFAARTVTGGPRLGSSIHVPDGHNA